MEFCWKILEKNKRIKITKIKEKWRKQKIIIDYFLLTKWLKLNKKYINSFIVLDFTLKYWYNLYWDAIDRLYVFKKSNQYV
mgnify:FL=1